MEEDSEIKTLKKDLETMGFEKPNCRSCVFRQELGWSSHSKCGAVSKLDLSPENIQTINVTGRIKVKEVKFHEHGVNNGWADWPTNFDPCWLEECSLYEPKSSYKKA